MEESQTIQWPKGKNKIEMFMFYDGRRIMLIVVSGYVHRRHGTFIVDSGFVHRMFIVVSGCVHIMFIVDSGCVNRMLIGQRTFYEHNH
jgi:hypothetical protein